MEKVRPVPLCVTLEEDIYTLVAKQSTERLRKVVSRESADLVNVQNEITTKVTFITSHWTVNRKIQGEMKRLFSP